MQLPLNIKLKDELTFANFWMAEDSSARLVVKALQAMDGIGEKDHFVFLWGSRGSGRSHLLQATCQYAQQQGKQFQYLPLRELSGFSPDALFESMEQLDVLCLDELECVLGDARWEEALFHLFNRVQQQKSMLVISASSSPGVLEVQLPDLKSRLAWGAAYCLDALDDDGKRQVLQYRASLRGMEFKEDVLDYLLSRHGRGLSELFETLDQLDHLSLVEKRKLTIPFVREVLANSPGNRESSNPQQPSVTD